MSASGHPGTDEDVAAELRRTRTIQLVLGGTFLVPSVAALAVLATAGFPFAGWIVAVEVSLRVLMLVWSQRLFRQDDAKAIAAGAGVARRMLRESGEKAAKALSSRSWLRDLILPAVYAVTAALSGPGTSGDTNTVPLTCIALVVAGVIEILVGRMVTVSMSARALAVTGPVTDAEVREVASRVVAADGRAAAVGHVAEAGRRRIDDAMTDVDSLPASKRRIP